MNGAGVLLVGTVAVPLVMLAACGLPRLRARISALLWLAPVPGLLAALLAHDSGSVGLPRALYGATLSLDVPAALLLGTAALLWIAGGVYAHAYFGREHSMGFVPWWLLVLAGNLGVFVAADIASFYLFFAMASLAAYGLITYDGTPRARRAGAIYVGLAIAGEACVVMGLVLLAAATPNNSLLIRDAVAALPASPWAPVTIALLIAGFGVKIGLVPVHVWMPLAYRAAPIPAAAVLSGAAVKTGVMGMIRFLPADVAQPGLAKILVAVGLFSAFYGVVVGITQSNPKTVLAYSSVSQMGLIAAVIGAGLGSADGSAGLAAAFYASHHVLVKGALFLAIGVAATSGTRSAWPVLLPAAIIALGLAGLPLTGGAVVKAAIKGPLGEGAVELLAALSAAGTTILMLHFLERLRATTRRGTGLPASPELTIPWLALAACAVAIPWVLFPRLLATADVLSLKALWSVLWPVLLGGAIAYGLRRMPQRLPRVPEGDIVAGLGPAMRSASVCGAALEAADDRLRQWAIAGISLLAIAIALGASLAGVP